MTVPTVEPTTISLGETIKFTRDLPDYPAGTWTLNYYFVNATAGGAFAAIAVGTTHSVNVPKATTAIWVAGDYQLTGVVTATVLGVPEQYPVYTGLLTILPNKASSQPIEFRSWAVRTLAADHPHAGGENTERPTGYENVFEVFLGIRRAGCRLPPTPRPPATNRS